MGKVIVSQDIIQDPVAIMNVLLREVEIQAAQNGMDPVPIKEQILVAPTIEKIQTILGENFEGDLVLLEKNYISKS